MRSVRPIVILVYSLTGFVPNMYAQNAYDEPYKGKSYKTDPWSMADEYWGKNTMQKSRKSLREKHGDQKFVMIMADRLELQSHKHKEMLIWDIRGWYGGDINKFSIKTEGEVSLKENEVEDAEIQALWSRAVKPFWDIQAGLRYDPEPGGRTYAVLGIEGLAPYWFEVDATAFLSTRGEFLFNLETEYDLLLTQRLIVQPHAKITLSSRNIPELDIGSGLTSVDLGIRLRYEIRRGFAPYIGIEWYNMFGQTKNYVRAAGEDSGTVVAIIGMRIWY